MTEWRKASHTNLLTGVREELFFPNTRYNRFCMWLVHETRFHRIGWRLMLRKAEWEP